MATNTTSRRNPLAERNAQPVALASDGRERTQLEFDKIRINGGTQMRAGLNDATVTEYSDAMIEAGGWGDFPPLIVYHDGDDYWLGDGFHRLAAWRLADFEHLSLPVEVRPGTRRDAILHAAAANADHGLRRTNADKRRAVETLLRDEEWGQWSDRQIADKCKVSNRFVGIVRKELFGDDTVNGSQYERTFVHPKTGQPTTMNVAGQRQAAQERAEQKPSLTLDETIAVIWSAIRSIVTWTNDPAERRNWLFNTPEMSRFKQYVPTGKLGRPIDADTFAAARERVLAELEGQIAHAKGKEERSQRTLNTYDTQNLIWRALNDVGGEPAERLAWLTSEQGMDISSYEKYLAAGTVIAPGAFDLVWRLVHGRLTEMVASDESRAAEAERWQAAAPAAGPGDAWRQYATSVATEMGAPAEVAGLGDEDEEPAGVAVVGNGPLEDDDDDEPGELPPDLVALGCKLDQAEGWYFVSYGSKADTCGSLEQAIAVCRKWTGTDEPAAGGGCEEHRQRVAGIQAELEFWRDARKRVERIGPLIHIYTGPPSALSRAIDDVVKLLQENVSA